MIKFYLKKTQNTNFLFTLITFPYVQNRTKKSQNPSFLLMFIVFESEFSNVETMMWSALICSDLGKNILQLCYTGNDYVSVLY